MEKLEAYLVKEKSDYPKDSDWNVEQSGIE